MRSEIRVVLFSALFVGGIGAVYWFTSYEEAGTTMLVMAALAYLLLCGFLYLQARRFRAGEGDSWDGARQAGASGESGASGPPGENEIGYFPAASVWPAALALGGVFTALGLVFGYWFLVIAAIVVVGAIIGYAVEAQVPH